ncbi:hypothetical protein Leryth_011665 [Lithospermum erythrorhizon]|nr:hypothetical protein Leryth_011665 [Lithospermum erythrorhizon]
MATEQSVLALIRASRPTFRNHHDKAAFAIHAAFLSAGFVLNATGATASSDDALSTTSSTDEVGIDKWNEFEENYAFIYSKGAKKVLVKCLVMNDKLMVDALKEGDSEPMHLEINVEDYVRDNGEANYSSQFKNLGKLVADVDSHILNKVNGSPKDASSKQATSSESRGLRDDDHPNYGYIETDHRSPFYHPSGVVVPPVPPFGGGSDLFPEGVPGMYPSRGDFGGSGGMLIGPHDPRFFGGRGEPGLPGGFHGGQPGIPPGVRFDPYGPPSVPGFEPGRFVREPRRPGRGTHPDLEHFDGGDDFI